MVRPRVLTIGVWQIVGNNRMIPPKNIPRVLEYRFPLWNWESGK